jgi:hypothetical protein
MKIVTSLDDDVTVEVSYLEDIGLTYVLNSKSIWEFNTLYYYKISFLSTFDGSKFIEIKDFWTRIV